MNADTFYCKLRDVISWSLLLKTSRRNFLIPFTDSYLLPHLIRIVKPKTLKLRIKLVFASKSVLIKVYYVHVIILLGSRVRQSTKSLLHCTNKTIYLVTLIVLAWDVSRGTSQCFLHISWNCRVVELFKLHGCGMINSSVVFLLTEHLTSVEDQWAVSIPPQSKQQMPG